MTSWTSIDGAWRLLIVIPECGLLVYITLHNLSIDASPPSAHVDVVEAVAVMRKEDRGDVDHILVLHMPQDPQLTQRPLREGDVLERRLDLYREPQAMALS